ncbi:capsular polysaccharide biosynthesis protein [Enterococcus florum]|uniref:Capsular polysaccharide biosynthesis protein n=1 Tax=Enterococcus florum TaxID=2480627 RepID=A0A4P5PDC2_9ENTE|nr:CapA family protein [Enterococcus florum]GCF94351.1 capsular polysaccharide biosynthesis protein [Enterococcus florum]
MKKTWVVLMFVLVILTGCTTNQAEKGTASEAKNQADRSHAEISFSAVGDNLMHEFIYQHRQREDGSYDFDPMYEPTRYLTKNADISYINLETICAGEELGLSGYPTFNGPTQVLDSLHQAGFNWLAAASNHTFDRGEEGVVKQLDYLKKYPDITATGSRRSEKDPRFQVVEIDGVKIGLASYTYGLNGFELPEGKEYLVNLIDDAAIKKDLRQMNKKSDLQIVSMHWGEEYQFVPNDEQVRLAQLLSDEGADVIVGGHPHVIQPMDYLEGKKGNQTLVIYSLGNFLSSQAENDRMLGGMARWKIDYDKKKRDFRFKEVQFLPTITYIGDNYQTYEAYALKDYTNDLANQHMIHVNQGQDLSREYFIQRVKEIMNEKIELVY